MDLEHAPPGSGESPEEDIFARWGRRRQQLEEKTVEDFSMRDYGYPGLLIRYRRMRIEPYRKLADVEREWERWAQLLIGACEGFYQELADKDANPKPILDELQRPLTWDTFAPKIGIQIEEDRGIRGVVIDVFGGHEFESSMISHAQAVDRWMTSAVVTLREDLEKGS